jgi:uncharacterized protein
VPERAGAKVTTTRIRCLYGACALLFTACAANAPAPAAPLGGFAAPATTEAPPARPAALPFRLPCEETDVQGCTKGCSEKVTEDCVTLASMYMMGAGVERDAERAAGMFRAACNEGSARGCMRLGDAYHDGVLKGDIDEIDSYKRACDAGANQGCVVAGKAYLSGRGVGADPVFAAALFKRVCEKGNAAACFELAQQYSSGEGVTKNPARASELFDKACKLGLDAGCLGASKKGDVLSPRD